MIQLLTAKDIAQLVQHVGLDAFFKQLVSQLESDFKRWAEFSLTPRHATHYPQGVIELMPTADDQYYSFKYVNGHPGNPQYDKLNVVAMGQLSDTLTGYPMLICDMTLATGLRTAATSALAAQYLINSGTPTLAIIGTGAQSEFQVLAQHAMTQADTVFYYDTDPAAMEKFERNLQSYPLKLNACSSIQEACEQANLVTTATAAKRHGNILDGIEIQPGTLINAIGGDCPGKTELSPSFIKNKTIIVELLEQTKIEGEIQHRDNVSDVVELWEIIVQKRQGRKNKDEIIIFDSVGCAVEDFSIMQLFHTLAPRYRIGEEIELLPHLDDPKDLFGYLNAVLLKQPAL